MLKKNSLIIIGILLLAGLLLLLSTFLRTQADTNLVIIAVDGQEYKRVPLTEPQIVVIEQESGEINEIEISDHGAVMLSSTCKNQKCVNMGEVNLENWEYRVNGSFIVCLPNRVTVELVAKE